MSGRGVSSVCVISQDFRFLISLRCFSQFHQNQEDITRNPMKEASLLKFTSFCSSCINIYVLRRAITHEEVRMRMHVALCSIFFHIFHMFSSCTNSTSYRLAPSSYIRTKTEAIMWIKAGIQFLCNFPCATKNKRSWQFSAIPVFPFVNLADT